MEIRHMRYFVGIAESGSISKASEKLRIAQPSLSIHLANLEAELGVNLVIRTSRGIELTEEGQLLYKRSLELLRYHNDIVKSLQDFKNKPKGSVYIGMPSAVTGLISSEICKSIKKNYPEISINIIEASSSIIFDWISNGNIDIAILLSIPEGKGFDVYPVFLEEYCLVEKYDESSNGLDIPLGEVCEIDIAMPGKSTVIRKIVEESARARGKFLNCVMETDSYSALRSLAISGCYSVILPYASVREDVEERKISARRIIDPVLQGVVCVVSPKGKKLSPASSATLNELIQTCRSIGERQAIGVRKRPGVSHFQAVPSPLFPHRPSQINKLEV